MTSTRIATATRHDESPLGGWIRSVRLRQGLSQRELADRSGLSRSYVCDIERGRGAHPSVETLDKLGAALGFSRVDLLRASGVIETVTGPRETDEERRMLAVFRDLTDAGRISVLRFARFVHTDEHRWVQGSLIDSTDGTPDTDSPPPVPEGMTRLFDVGDD
jgi:transcriptional regulator with XRE-family HTH domain